MQNDGIEKGQKLHNILFLPYLRVTWRQFPKLTLEYQINHAYLIL